MNQDFDGSLFSLYVHPSEIDIVMLELEKQLRECTVNHKSLKIAKSIKVAKHRREDLQKLWSQESITDRCGTEDLGR